MEGKHFPNSHQINSLHYYHRLQHRIGRLVLISSVVGTHHASSKEWESEVSTEHYHDYCYTHADVQEHARGTSPQYM